MTDIILEVLTNNVMKAQEQLRIALALLADYHPMNTEPAPDSAAEPEIELPLQQPPLVRQDGQEAVPLLPTHVRRPRPRLVR